MGSITSSIGLISGIDSGSLIEQLLQIEARPKQLAQQRILQLQQKQAAFLSINSSLLALGTAAGKFRTENIFQATSATSSDSDVLTATSSSRASEGSYNFRVDRLVSTQRMLSRGFANRDSSGIGATEFSFEIGGGSINESTDLSELNGGNGIKRGKISITDRAGNTATVDLSTVVTVQDVLDRINGEAGIGVSASVDDGSIVITDETGQTASNLIIADAFGYQTATSLGIKTAAGGVASDTVVGSNIRTVSENTALSLLNDGLGVLVRDGSTDFRIFTRDGGPAIAIDLGELTQEIVTEGEFEGEVYDPDTMPTGDDKPDTEQQVVRSRAATLGDVIEQINEQSEGKVTAQINAEGTGLELIDNTTDNGAAFRIAEGSSDSSIANTAKGLGLSGLIGAGVTTASFTGDRLLSGLNTVLTRNINGGQGLTSTDLTVTDRAGNTLDLSGILTDADLNGSLNALVNTINSELSDAGVSARFELNSAGNGLSAVDTSGATAGNFTIAGTLAAELGLEKDSTAITAQGSNLQMKWISQATTMDQLNQGRGIDAGEIRITDASGSSQTITIRDDFQNVNELIEFLNSRPNIEIEAAINDTGDGIVIRDISGGAGDLVIEDVTGTAAKQLNIDGTFSREEGAPVSEPIVADGSYEFTIEFEETDTLQQVMTKINNAGVGVSASIVNDGSANSPYRMNFTSRYTGSAGKFILDTHGFDLGLEELARAEDAVVFFGADDPAKAVLLTSTTNTLDNVVEGVTIDLKSASDDPVELVVQRDTAKIEESVKSFVDAFNAIIDTIARYDKYDEETETRGTLLGDNTVAQVRQGLYRAIQGRPQDVDGQFQYLFQVGVKIGDGAKLEFDRDQFREALETDYDNVAELFAAFEQAPREPVEIAPGAFYTPDEDSYNRLGVAEQIKLLMNNFTNSIDGTLTRKDESLNNLIDLQEKRVERFDIQLDNRRAQLEAQFAAMEQALAQLQNQQSALSSLG
ncbi:MAG: flagellar filament capping protein FliD [Phycisphaerales bacterium JB050]